MAISTLAQNQGKLVGVNFPGIDVGSKGSSDPIDFSNTNCKIGYPFQSSNPATSIVFNESDILAAFSADKGVINIYYSDEHALSLGVRQVVVKNANGTQNVTNYPVSALTASPSSVVLPQIGTFALSGDQAGTDVSTCPGGASGNCARPLAPALFVTDITSDPNSTAGDWQYGGTPVAPSAVRGSWKSAVRTVDHTLSPAKITLAVDSDPSMNHLNLGDGFQSPSFVADEGFTTMISWDLSQLGLSSGHSYRLQFMVHDGDQHYSGGDAGENCLNVQIP